MKLDRFDLKMAYQRLPKSLDSAMKDSEWKNRIFVGGGYLRSIVTNETINDVDVFVPTKQDAELLAFKLVENKSDIIQTQNAYTVRGKTDIQIIHRWVFEKPEDVTNSFDFSVCCAVIFYNGMYDSYCDERFYQDIAGKRIVYRCPVRNEDAGGSLLRVLKYYQKGYRIPLDSLGNIIARLMQGVDAKRCGINDEVLLGKVITGLLREVDPNTDILQSSHFPADVSLFTESIN